MGAGRPRFDLVPVARHFSTSCLMLRSKVHASAAWRFGIFGPVQSHAHAPDTANDFEEVQCHTRTREGSGEFNNVKPLSAVGVRIERQWRHTSTSQDLAGAWEITPDGCSIAHHRNPWTSNPPLVVHESLSASTVGRTVARPITPPGMCPAKQGISLRPLPTSHRSRSFKATNPESGNTSNATKGYFYAYAWALAR